MKITHLLMLFWLSGYMPLLNAHAVVTDYSLKIKPIKAEQTGSVSLDFNSKIELGLSQIFLVSKGDQLSPLTISKGSKQGQLLVAVPALPSGDYALKIKVFAADGHLTEDVIHFTVAP
ncbi:MAG: copper resistance protein CopC [Methylovulum sp.]|nr:copper resistance protein CopC [Methylovulum sp.]MCF7999205.1 copper resistance protein CopC [Methylovulum sp.]